ncbi:MAG: hypothetical protein WC635_10030 [Bacteriovorax sp.]|jgi:hypothetical protein
MKFYTLIYAFNKKYYNGLCIKMENISKEFLKFSDGLKKGTCTVSTLKAVSFLILAISKEKSR